MCACSSATRVQQFLSRFQELQLIKRKETNDLGHLNTVCQQKIDELSLQCAQDRGTDAQQSWVMSTLITVVVGLQMSSGSASRRQQRQPHGNP